MYLAVPFVSSYGNKKSPDFILLGYVLFLMPLRFPLEINDLLCQLVLVLRPLYNLCWQIKQRDFIFCKTPYPPQDQLCGKDGL